MNTCEWRQVQRTHEVEGRKFTFDDEWETGCIHPYTMQIIPYEQWKLCPYCGKKIKWLSEPEVVN